MRATGIVLAHGSEPHLNACLTALRDQCDEVIVVDNAADAEALSQAVGRSDARVLRPGRNVGFAQGCNLAAREASGDVLVFVNSDAEAQPGSVAALAARVGDPRIALASASVRLADSPHLLNSAGNPVHFLMFSWTGGLGEPASAHPWLTQVASISGAMFAVRRDVWEELGGFIPEYFAYCEDAYLSQRAWQAGYWVVHEPRAVARHHYDPARNPAKRYLLERNRLLNLLLLPQTRTLALIAVPTLVVELGVLGLAMRQGWAGDKVAGWRWLVTHREALRRWRGEVQAARTVSDGDLGLLLRGHLDPPSATGPGVPAAVDRMLAAFWRWAVVRL